LNNLAGASLILQNMGVDEADFVRLLPVLMVRQTIENCRK
jgi:hypothetical protein